MAQRRYVSGWCNDGFCGRCPHKAQDEKVIVKNTASGTQTRVIPEVWCSCSCHSATQRRSS